MISSVTNMNITAGLIERASSSRCTLYTTAAKIASYTVLPFLAIATFEAFVINAFRLIANVFTTHKPTLPGKKYSCTPEQRAIILEIAQTVADTPAPFLAFKGPHLYWLKPKIDPVHPLKFLSTILQHPEGKRYIRDTLDSLMKRTTFMGDVSSNLETELKNNTLYPYLDGFAKEVKIPAATLKPFIERQDWDGFVRALES